MEQRRQRRNERGNGLVEMALVLPVAMCFLLGILTGGQAYFQKISLVDAAREGARYGASLKIPTASAADWKQAVKNRVAALSGGQVTAADVCAELVTLGQRRGLGTGGGPRRYAVSVDTVGRTVVVGDAGDLEADSVRLTELCWVREPVEGGVAVQTSAHGAPVQAWFEDDVVRFSRPHRRVAPGQSVVLYRGDEVLGGGIAAA